MEIWVLDKSGASLAAISFLTGRQESMAFKVINCLISCVYVLSINSGTFGIRRNMHIERRARMWPPGSDGKPRERRAQRPFAKSISCQETSRLQHLSTVSVDKAVELRTQIAAGPTCSRATRASSSQKRSMTRTRSVAMPRATALHGNSDLHQQNAPHGKTIGPD